MWNDYDLPMTATIDGVEYKMNTNYKNIMEIFKIFNSPNLLDEEKLYLALTYFYNDIENISSVDEAIRLMMLFINGNKEDTKQSEEKPLMDWEKDFSIIVAPINKVLGYDARGKDYVHWWTFLSAFMEIGECTFNTYVGIRDKKNRGKKLDKHEELIYKKNHSQIDIVKKVDDTTQALIDKIMGV